MQSIVISAQLDEVLPGVCEGLYLTGSIALGDWCPGRSDLDVLTVTTRKLDDADIEVLAGLHAGLAKRPCLDAIYIDFDEVGRVPVAGSARPAAFGERKSSPLMDIGQIRCSGRPLIGAA